MAGAFALKGKAMIYIALVALAAQSALSEPIRLGAFSEPMTDEQFLSAEVKNQGDRLLFSCSKTRQEISVSIETTKYLDRTSWFLADYRFDQDAARTIKWWRTTGPSFIDTDKEIARFISRAMTAKRLLVRLSDFVGEAPIDVVFEFTPGAVQPKAALQAVVDACPNSKVAKLMAALPK